MAKERIDADALLEELCGRLVMTMPQMRGVAGCSTMSVWRILSAQGYLTSLNFNSRYYTLRKTPAFDSRGLWVLNRIVFSVHGTLPRTVRALVEESPSGLTEAALRELLGVNVGPTLRKLHRSEVLSRQKYGGVFVYLAADEQMSRSQRQRRCAKQGVPGCSLLPPELVIAVLVELIQQVELTPLEVAQRLGARGLSVSENSVRSVFDRYALDSTARKKNSV